MSLKKPLKMVHAGGKDHARENSVKAVRISMAHNADIIELDIRKSRDGVLFCYHGFGVAVYMLAFLLRFLKFKTIKRLFGINSLEEVLKVIDRPAIINLDIKQINIRAEDIRGIHFQPYHQVWLSYFMFNHLKKLKNELGDEYKFIFHLSVWFFDRNLRKAKEAGISAFQIFPWQCTEENIRKIKEAGMQHVIAPVLVSKKRFHELVKRFGSHWICFNGLKKPNNFASIRDYL